MSPKSTKIHAEGKYGSRCGQGDFTSRDLSKVECKKCLVQAQKFAKTTEEIAAAGARLQALSAQPAEVRP